MIFFCYFWTEITSSIISSLDLGLFFQYSGFFHIDFALSLFFLCFFFFMFLLSTCYDVFYRRFVVVDSCVVDDFVSFHIGSSNGKFRSDRVIISNLVRQYSSDLECKVF